MRVELEMRIVNRHMFSSYISVLFIWNFDLKNILNLFYLIPDQVCVLRIDAVTQFIISGYDDVTLRHLLCVPLHSRVSKVVADYNSLRTHLFWKGLA